MDKEQEMLKRLAAIKHLPTLPVVIDRLTAALRDPKSDGRRIARIIEDDPAIMARTMKVVNSAYYGGLEPITSLHHAVARLGIGAIRNIVLSTSVFSAFGKGSGVGLDRKEFWRHSICSGIAAAIVRESARGRLNRNHTKDVLRLAGLIHDIGKIFYDEFFHEEFAEALRLAASGQMPLCLAEKVVLGMDHAEVGMWLVTKWNLGSDLAQALCWHHNPDRVEEACWELAAFVNVGNYICNIEKIGVSGDPVPTFLPDIWKRIGLELSDISGIAEKIHAESANSEIMMALV